MSHAQALCHVEKLENYPTQQGAIRRCIWGFHLIVELWEAPFDLLADASKVLEGLKASLNGNGKKVNGVSYQFQPFGASAQVNSGFANVYIHTWPENGYAAIDIMASSKEEAYQILERIKKAFSPKHLYVIEVPRGITTEEWGET